MEKTELQRRSTYFDSTIERLSPADDSTTSEERAASIAAAHFKPSSLDPIFGSVSPPPILSNLSPVTVATSSSPSHPTCFLTCDLSAPLFPLKYIPPITRIDDLIGLARPGYEAHNSKSDWSYELQQIRETLDFLETEGVKMVISLSNSEYHGSHDPKIEEYWISKGPTFLYDYILNMDSFDPDFYASQGPTYKKIEKFLKLRNRVREGRIAIYCGAGQGRTYSYLTAHIIKSRGIDPEAALNELFKISECKLTSTIRDEMEQNGGLKALGEFYRKLKK